MQFPPPVKDRSTRPYTFFVLEAVLVAACFAADKYGYIPLSKTLPLLAIGWISLRLRGLNWKKVGLHGLNRRLLLTGVVAGIAFSAWELLATQPLLIHLTGQKPDLSDFNDLIGNTGLLVVALLLVWTLAAFGEELVYRGYLMNRVAEIGGGSSAAWIASLVLVHALFGAAHVYQGITGVAENFVGGLLLGGLYLWSGRNLWPPIIAHGVLDTIDVILIYLGRYPTM